MQTSGSPILEMYYFTSCWYQSWNFSDTHVYTEQFKTLLTKPYNLLILFLTTGTPKGAMISHRNMSSVVAAAYKTLVCIVPKIFQLADGQSATENAST